MSSTDNHQEAEPLKIDHEKRKPEIQSSGSLSFSDIKSKAFFKIWLYQLLSYIPWISAGIFLPLYGAQWFGGCLVNGIDIVDPECIPDYQSYAFWSTLFQSLGGIISFTFASFVGRLSDSYGRKWFYVIGILGWAIPRFVMCFYVNFFVYWTIGLLADVNADELAVKGSVADLIEQKKRINAFGKIHIAAGVGLILGTGMTVAISSVWGNHSVFYALCIFYGVILLYIFIFMDETIDINNNRRELKNACRNPIRPLRYAFQNKLILYISFVALSLSMCESGIMSVLLPYIGSEMKLHDDGKASMVFGIYVIIIAISLSLASGVILPILEKRISDTSLLVWSVIIEILSLILLGSISFYPNYVTLYLSGFLYGASFFCWPCFDGIISKYVTKSCQGTAFGIEMAYIQLAAIFGPFSFGYLYTALNKADLPYIFILTGIGFCVIALILIIFPLRKQLNMQYKKSKSIQLTSAAYIDENEINDDEDNSKAIQDIDIKMDDPNKITLKPDFEDEMPNSIPLTLMRSIENLPHSFHM